MKKIQTIYVTYVNYQSIISKLDDTQCRIACHAGSNGRYFVFKMRVC